MRQMLNRKIIFTSFILLLASIFFMVACESASSFLNDEGTRKLTRSAGISDKVMGDASTVMEAGGKLVEAFESFHAAFSDMSIEDERALGESVSLQAYASPQIGAPIHHPKLMFFLNRMANVLAQNSERPMIPYHVAIVHSSDFNAFAAPGGYIFLTSALVLNLDNEAELAAVIGHELGHIVKKHAVADLQNGKAWEGFGKIVEAGSKVTANVFEENLQEFGKLVTEMSGQLIGSFNQYDTSIELEADYVGVQCALDTGYDPQAMLSVFEKLKAYYPKDSKTHPSLEERSRRVQEFIAQQNQEDLEGLVTRTGRLERVKQWIREDLDWQP